MDFFFLVFVVVAVVLLIVSRFDLIAVGLSLYFFSLFIYPPCVKFFSFSPATILSYLLTIYSTYVLCQKKCSQKRRNLIYAVMSVLVFYLAAFIFTLPFAYQMPSGGIFPAIKDFLLTCMPPYFVVILLSSTKSIGFFLKFFVVLMFFVSLYGFFCYWTQTNIYSLMVQVYYPDSSLYERFIEEDRAGLEGRIGGFVGHPVFYAGMLVSSLFLILFFSIKMYLKKNMGWLFFSMIVFICTVCNMFLSGTRAGLVAFILGLIYFMFRILSLRKVVLISLFFFSFFSFMSLFPIFGKYQPMVDSVVCFWSEKETQQIEIKGSSISMRIDQLKGSFDMLSGPQILFGYGAGWVSDYISKNGYHPVLLGFESLLFTGLIQFGVLGFILIYLKLFYSLGLLSKKCRQSKDASVIPHLIVSFLLSYFIYAMITGAFYLSLFLTSFFIVVSSECHYVEQYRCFYIIKKIRLQYAANKENLES